MQSWMSTTPPWIFWYRHRYENGRFVSYSVWFEVECEGVTQARTTWDNMNEFGYKLFDFSTRP